MFNFVIPFTSFAFLCHVKANFGWAAAALHAFLCGRFWSKIGVHPVVFNEMDSNNKMQWLHYEFWSNRVTLSYTLVSTRMHPIRTLIETSNY